MAKYWTAGDVKTRLGATIGAAAAAEIHRLFCRDLCLRLATFEGLRQLVLSPDDLLDEARNELPASWSLIGQGDGDLGERMARWFCHCSQDCSGHPDIEPRPIAILIGADCPSIELATIEQAVTALATSDLVLGPAVDGGYYLIGLRLPWRDAYRALFRELPWSTAKVLEITRQRAAEEALTVAELDLLEDIDTIDELERLLGTLSQPAPDSAPQAKLRTAIVHVLARTRWPATGGAASQANDTDHHANFRREV